VFAGRKIIARHDEAPATQSETKDEPITPVTAPLTLTVKTATNTTQINAIFYINIGQTVERALREELETTTKRLTMLTRHSPKINASGQNRAELTTW
jgi:hypothetical protein